MLRCNVTLVLLGGSDTNCVLLDQVFLEPLRKGRQLVRVDHIVQGPGLEMVIAGEVDANAIDGHWLGAATDGEIQIQCGVADKLVPIDRPQCVMFGRLNVDQKVVEQQICVCASH